MRCSAVSSIIISVILGLPLVPERPARHSWTPSAIFPAAVIAAGLVAVCIEPLGVTGIYGGIDLGIIVWCHLSPNDKVLP